jgi:uncharacterized GH25 family protein
MNAVLPGRTSMSLLALAWLGLASIAAPAVAHEFWIEPSQTAPAAGGHIGVYLCNGDGYDGWSLPRDPGRVALFTAYGPEGARPIVGLDGSDPAGFVRFERGGPHVLAYTSQRAVSVMPPAKFERYLTDKGLDGPLASRRAQVPGDIPVRETYSRYAKLLLSVGSDGAFADRRLGLPLEIVTAPGDVPGASTAVGFQLLYRGQPLAGALVTATRLGAADAGVAVRSATDGRVSFRFDTPGFWRVAAVYMTRPPAGVDAEWDSLWASLTFDVPGSELRTAAPWSTGAPHCQNLKLVQTAQASP